MIQTPSDKAGNEAKPDAAGKTPGSGVFGTCQPPVRKERTALDLRPRPPSLP